MHHRWPQSIYQSARTVRLSFGLTLLDQTFFGFRGDANQVTEAYTAQVFTTVSIITQAKNDKDVIEFFVDLVIEIVCTLVIYAMILRGLCFIQLQSDFLFFVVFIGFVF